jgi:non-canonical purine NTP pyrophosphatase (RdgB/HAM1 family)
MPNAVTFVTSNKHKAALLRLHAEGLDLEITLANLPLVEPQAASVEAVVASKAAQAFQRLQSPLIVEDTGFAIDGLRGFPGPYSKYILQTIGAQGLIDLAKPLTTRGCGFVNAMVYVDAQGEQHLFVDESGRGQLAEAVDETPCAEMVSDLWKIFIPDGASATLNAMSADERKQLWRVWERSSVYTRCAQWLAERSRG